MAGKKRTTKGALSDSAPLSRGPKPEHVHIEGDWEDAVKKALKKPPPLKAADRDPAPNRPKPHQP